jgi:hypothetical protein
MSQNSWTSFTPKGKRWKDCLNVTNFDSSFANMKKKPVESFIGL